MCRCKKQGLIKIVRPSTVIQLDASIALGVDPLMAEVMQQEPSVYASFASLRNEVADQVSSHVRPRVILLEDELKRMVCNYNARLVAEYAARPITESERQRMTCEFYEAVMKRRARVERRESLNRAAETAAAAAIAAAANSASSVTKDSAPMP